MTRFLLSALSRAATNLLEFRFLNVITVGVIAVSLLLVSTFLLVLWNLSQVLDRWGQDVQVSAYLQEGVAEEAIFRLKGELEGMPEVEEVLFVSKADAARHLIEGLPEAEEVLEDLPANPLPASLEIRLRGDLQSPGAVKSFAKGISRPEFVEIDYSQEWVERFHAFMNLLRISAVVMGGLLLSGSMFVVNNTIKLTVYARREELEIMELVGATPAFIRAPFLVEGLVQGGLGSALALVGSFSLYRGMFSYLREALELPEGAQWMGYLPVSWVLLLALSGLVLGGAGAWLSTRRFLGSGL